MTDRHHKLNAICTQCGEYGTLVCATCPIEQYRQQEVLIRMKHAPSSDDELQTHRIPELYEWMVSA